MRVSIIVAVADNGVIGRDGGLPWRLSSDLKRFKSLTMGHHLVMGRRTWESIGRALPGRTSIVLSGHSSLELPEGVLRAGSMEAALALAAGDEEVFVIGGAAVYRAALPSADRLYLTRVHATVAGDTTLELDLAGWRRIAHEEHPGGGRDEHPTTFEVWERSETAPV